LLPIECPLMLPVLLLLLLLSAATSEAERHQ